MTFSIPENTQSRKTSSLNQWHFQVHFLLGTQFYIGKKRILLFKAKKAFASITEAPRQQAVAAALL